LWVYTDPTVAGGNVVEPPITSVESTGKVRSLDAVWLEESVTVAANVTGPGVDGVPLRTPAELNVNPAGRPVADHV
jgi:hypothetical protein